MCGFPSKTLILKGKLPADEVLRRLAANIDPEGEAKQEHPFSGAISGHTFTIKNRSKLPASVEGEVSTDAQGTVVKAVIKQSKWLTLGELALLLAIVAIAPSLFSSGAGDTVAWPLIVAAMLALYTFAFFGEVTQAREFFHTIWEEKAV